MASITLAEGSAASTPSSGNVVVYAKTDGTLYSKDDAGTETSLGGGAARSYLAGCTLSTTGSSATMSIAAGQATDSTNAYTMLLSAIAKTTSAWAVGTGNGGLDTGSIANNTWYSFYVIKRLDTGVVDVVFSTSASSPTLPANYTIYRRIGSGRTNGSAQWTAFIQDGDMFQWLAAVADVGVTNPGTAAVTRTLTVPTGVNVVAFGSVDADDSSGTAIYSLLTDLAVNDQAVALGLGQQTSINATAINAGWMVRTNTSAQIRSRLNASAGTTSLRIYTWGWYDYRGKNL